MIINLKMDNYEDAMCGDYSIFEKSCAIECGYVHVIGGDKIEIMTKEWGLWIFDFDEIFGTEGYWLGVRSNTTILGDYAGRIVVSAIHTPCGILFKQGQEIC